MPHSVFGGSGEGAGRAAAEEVAAASDAILAASTAAAEADAIWIAMEASSLPIASALTAAAVDVGI